MILQRYHLTVQFVKKKENVLTDTLSRAPIRQVDPIKQSELKRNNVHDTAR